MTNKVRPESFFFIFAKKKIPKMDNIFQPSKKKCGKKKLQPPDWPQLRPPAGQETDFFFVDSLM